MPISFGARLKHAWNAFTNTDDYRTLDYNIGTPYSIRPDRLRLTGGNERSIVSSVYNRIAIDTASISIRHVRLDENGRFKETINSGLNRCLGLEANIDQSGPAFIRDAVMSMCDEGVIALIPVDTTINPIISGTYDIQTLRTGKILEWYPQHIRVDVYNDREGRYENLVLPKKTVAVIENPLYAVMNEPNSTLKRLINKLNLLDAIDNQSGSGKLDLIIQLPYVIKTQARIEQAERRRKALEEQLQDSKYGIGYVDGTERVTQLNRPAENNLMGQIEYLTRMLYGQLGMTESILDGTADEATMLNYYNRTIEPILSTLAIEMKRTFLTKTAISQGQSIGFYRNPFTLVTVSELAEIADTFTRNEILSSNEVRAIIGYKPDSDPESDKLRNKNLNKPDEFSEEGSDEDPEEDLNEEV